MIYSLLLTESGHLLEVCPFTYCISSRNTQENFLIDEMIIMECNDENIELLVLLKCKNNEDERVMKIVEYPCEYCV